MTGKEALEYMYGVAICGSGVGETGDKVRECYNIIADSLEELKKQDEILEIIKKYITPYKVYNDYTNEDDEYFDLDSYRMSKQDYDKLKEWLENNTI